MCSSEKIMPFKASIIESRQQNIHTKKCKFKKQLKFCCSQLNLFMDLVLEAIIAFSWKNNVYTSKKYIIHFRAKCSQFQKQSFIKFSFLVRIILVLGLECFNPNFLWLTLQSWKVLWTKILSTLNVDICNLWGQRFIKYSNEILSVKM